MENEEKLLKRVSGIAIAAMTVLLAGAMIYYKERMLFSDASYISFGRINFLDLSAQERRYGAYITQIFLLIGAKLHLSMRSILILYSASFNLFYLSVILVLVFRFRQYGMAILMALYYTMLVSDTWFWCNNEIHQGIALMFLFFGVAFDLAKRRTKLFIQVPVFVFLLALAIFTHPLVLIAVLYLWIFWWADKNIWPYNKISSIAYSALLSGIAAFKYWLSKKQGYDSAKIDTAMHSSLWSPHAFTNLFADTFWHDCQSNYWWLVLIYVTGLWILIKLKKYVQLIATIVFSFGFFVLASNTFGPNAYDYHAHFYMESEMMLLGIIGSAPFVFYILPKLTDTKATLLLSSIFITRFIYIMLALPLFKHRVEFIEKSLVQMKKGGLTKVVIKKDKRIDDVMLQDWGLPYESLLASKLGGDEPQIVFLTLPDQIDYSGVLPGDNKIMMGAWGGETLENDHYFRIDTTRPYSVMTYDQFFENK